ncbi:WD40 repeat-like protein [Myriangium duriaei CBS 260.36]|uniref:WD40 repeat-like protein n=1 Tax=Myriangium duriaei CBS 260.36 TaxID=1168546 RepID=A0A9P4MJ34_9PEZI|nr:WD40 repeat-like protein [Myriangium duriaei CBS 260.36]
MSGGYVDLTLSDEESSSDHKHNPLNHAQERSEATFSRIASHSLRRDSSKESSRKLATGSEGYGHAALDSPSVVSRRTATSGRCEACNQYFEHLLDHWKRHHRPPPKGTFRSDRAPRAVRGGEPMIVNGSTSSTRKPSLNSQSSIHSAQPGSGMQCTATDPSPTATSEDLKDASRMLPRPQVHRQSIQQQKPQILHSSSQSQTSAFPEAIHGPTWKQRFREVYHRAGFKAGHTQNGVYPRSVSPSGNSLHDSITLSDETSSNDEPPVTKRRRVGEGTYQVVVDTRSLQGQESLASVNPQLPRAAFSSTQTAIAMQAPLSTPSRAVAAGVASATPGPVESISNMSRHNLPYSREEDTLLSDLRQQGTPWAEIPSFFQGRTLGSLQVRYSTKLSKKPRKDASHNSQATRVTLRKSSQSTWRESSSRIEDKSPTVPLSMGGIRKLKRRATGGATRPQSVLKSQYGDDDSSEDEIEPKEAKPVNTEAQLMRLTRHRELAGNSVHGRSSQHDKLRIQNLAYESLGVIKYVDDASGDIATVAWSADNRHFAAGGVVLMDESSMQYNRPRNLLIGDSFGTMRELPEHHVRRPNVTKGVNSSDAMRQTQDERLFTTVQMVGFSPDNQHLYSVSTDGKLNSYNMFGSQASEVQFRSTFSHQGPVDLLTIGRHGLIATGCRSSQSNSISVFQNDGESLVLRQSLSSRSSETKDVSYASALKWGVAPHQSKWLLAGFGQEKERLFREDSDLDILGETCLYDGETGKRLDFSIPRNVFDVAWNPNLGHTAFAVACVGFGKVNSGMHTVIRVFGEGQAGLRCAVELECPARDINDLIYCPYDENLIAAGSTDGKVYVWDIRSTRISQDPQMALSHGSCVSVLPHDRKRWEVDTGVRFLSWGSNHSRLFSGSSDGVVKVWDPYVNNEDTHIRNIATFKSAIMSGAFNSDHTQLLIGEDQARLSLLEVGASDIAKPDRFSLLPAPDPAASESAPHKRLLESGEIVFEHCGALPIRQAVQGPNYKPPKPLLTPSEAEMHQRALRFQRDLFHQRNRWKRLKRAFTEESGKIPNCGLDCGYTPRVDGDGDEVPDSGRANDRVPDTRLRISGEATRTASL